MTDLAVAGVGLWPMRPRPFSDEAFSSWFYRLAAANSVRLHSFTSAAFPSKQVWNRDLDALADDEIFLALERGTGISHVRLRAKTLRAYQGTVFEQFNTHGTTPLILPLGLYHRIRRGFGFQFCPYCLSADKVPYARLEWRLACVTSCQRHGCRLLDRCGNCSGPYVFHRRGFHMCFSCGHDLRQCSTEPANQVALDCEALMREAMSADDGLCKVLNSKHSIISFSVIHDLLSLLSFGKRAPAFRQAVQTIFGGALPSDFVTVKSGYLKCLTCRRVITWWLSWDFCCSAGRSISFRPPVRRTCGGAGFCANANYPRSPFPWHGYWAQWSCPTMRRLPGKRRPAKLTSDSLTDVRMKQAQPCTYIDVDIDDAYISISSTD